MATSLALTLGILSSSFLGSWHCAGMCGPIASLMNSRQSLWSYHWGRMCSYIALGVLGGGLGEIFLNSDFIVLRWISSIVLSLILISSGLHLIFPQRFNSKKYNMGWSKALSTFIKRLQAFQLGRSGFLIGLLTALLPCGWLYTYVIAAMATRSPWGGGLTLFLFWLGGLPALSAVPLMIRETVRSAGLRQQRVAGAVLMTAGLYSIISFMFFH